MWEAQQAVEAQKWGGGLAGEWTGDEGSRGGAWVVTWGPTGTLAGQPSGMLEHDMGLKQQLLGRAGVLHQEQHHPPLSGKRCSLKRRSCMDEAPQIGWDGLGRCGREVLTLLMGLSAQGQAR